MPLDPNVRALMHSTCLWEKYASDDLYGDEAYAAAVSLVCHIEQGIDTLRTGSSDTVVPRLHLYFDAYDENVQSFGLRDRFTAPGIAGGDKKQPQRISPVYGDGAAWLVEVIL